MKSTGFAVASRIVQERIDKRHMEIHNERVAAVTAIVDSSEPEFADHLKYNAKKAEREAEKQYELEAENARMAQRLIAIDKLDSSQIIRVSTSRSTILSGKNGTFYSDVGGHQCIDHINANATANPGSLHYRRVSMSGTNTPPHGNPRRFGSRGPSPMRSSRVSFEGSGVENGVALDPTEGLPLDREEFPTHSSCTSMGGSTIRGSTMRGSTMGDLRSSRTSIGGSTMGGSTMGGSSSVYSSGGAPKSKVGSQPWSGQLQRNRPGAGCDLEQSYLDLSFASMSSLQPERSSSSFSGTGLPPAPPFRLRGPSPMRDRGLTQSTGDLASVRGPSPGRMHQSAEGSPMRNINTPPRPPTSQRPSVYSPHPPSKFAPQPPIVDIDTELSLPPLSDAPVGGSVGLLRSTRGPSPMRNSMAGGDSRGPSPMRPFTVGGGSRGPSPMRASIVGGGSRGPSPMHRPGTESSSMSDAGRTSISGMSTSASYAPMSEHMHMYDSEYRQERLKSVYYSGANLVQKGNTVTAVRRSNPMLNSQELRGSSPTMSHGNSRPSSVYSSPVRGRPTPPAASANIIAPRPPTTKRSEEEEEQELPSTSCLTSPPHSKGYEESGEVEEAL